MRPNLDLLFEVTTVSNLDFKLAHQHKRFLNVQDSPPFPVKQDGPSIRLFDHLRFSQPQRKPIIVYFSSPFTSVVDSQWFHDGFGSGIIGLWKSGSRDLLIKNCKILQVDKIHVCDRKSLFLSPWSGSAFLMLIWIQSTKINADPDPDPQHCLSHK